MSSNRYLSDYYQTAENRYSLMNNPTPGTSLYKPRKLPPDILKLKKKKKRMRKLKRERE